MSNRLWRIEYREAGAVSMTLGGDPTVLGDTFYIDFQRKPKSAESIGRSTPSGGDKYINGMVGSY